MCRSMLIKVVLTIATCVLGQNARATPETYDFQGYVAGSKVLDPAVPLPQSLVPCGCTHLFAPVLAGTLVVDLALPPEQRLLELHIVAHTGESDNLDVLPGHPDNRVVSQTSSDFGANIQPPHWEIITIAGRTGPRPAQAGRSIGIAIQWNGEPGAPRQFPPGAQDVDLATLTPGTSWRINFTLSDSSAVYATSFGNITIMRRRGTGGADFEDTFDDGRAQGWTPRNGQWAAATGDLRNAANASFTSSTIEGLTLPNEYVVLADVYLSWGASGNTAGILFEYRGPGDFYELRINAQGTAKLSRVAGGVRTIHATGTYHDAGVRRWSTVYIRRVGQRQFESELLIEINGQRVIDIGFGEDPSTGGTVGVFASWNLARFDNVLVGAPIVGFGGGMARFNSEGDNPPNFNAQSGTWTIANGYMRSSTNQAASIALTSSPQTSRVYGISGRIRLEWAGAGNWGGFVYDYIDARNYREVRLSRTVPGRLGEIVLAEIVRGVRREVFRAPRSQGTTDSELFVTLRRENDMTIVNELGVLSNIQVRQTPPSVPVHAGLFAAWNMVRFDDVAVYVVQQQ